MPSTFALDLYHYPIYFLLAELPDSIHNPFTRVRYLIIGQGLQDDGLRFDLGRQVFIDHFDNDEWEEILQRMTPRIAEKLEEAYNKDSPRLCRLSVLCYNSFV